ncbi:hypothetical protein GCM10011351_00020 [Paraliobacillus quinghaiensis]|uniref:Uncharacterized protein n=1 Tax=Paraliobacillus quinghaiensis TaxID=470815 RepID=A0A917TD25_9BACI|nr:hypothetical protein [Paraliobacillus quinghaiensis]GGM18249.1 hypothetical protein GCM10011351_00020 [Paraliobacillus quinghaiensis]
MRNKAKVILYMILVVLFLWGGIGVIDYSRVKGFEKPIFIIATNTADDGGSGVYKGLGYSFVIEGNFMPEDDFPGVTYYEYYIFRNLIDTGIRD